MAEDDKGPQDARGAGWREVSAEEAEAMLLEKLAACEQERERLTLNLVVLYSRTGRQASAAQYVRRLLAGTDDPERQAAHLLSLGQLMEQVDNLQAAAAFYTQGLALQAGPSAVRYLLHNNLGFCLNQFGRYEDAEPLCRAAIEIDPDRHNAYKNLGVALEGQGQYARAAELYVQAVRTHPGDPRALRHLEALVVRQREVTADLPDIQATIAQCREVVAMACRVH